MDDRAWGLLLARMADLRALQGAIGLLGWDRETYLPRKGAQARGEQLATLEALHHERLTAPELGDLLAAAEAESDGAGGMGGPNEVKPHPLDRRATLAALRFDRDRALSVPPRLVRELAERQSAAIVAWHRAREEEAFAPFAPHLEGLVALKREQAQHLLPTLTHGHVRRAGGMEGPNEVSPPHLYDALLEGHEPGMRVARLAPLFRNIAGWLAPLVERLAALPPAPDPFAGRRFEAEAQWGLTLEVLQAMGFDGEAGRQDRSVHPFTQGLDPCDVRLTTRVSEELPLSALFSTLHEGGHGLYEQGLPAEHRGTFLCAAASMGLHESQSRLWENHVGRSLPFWRHLLPRLAARVPGLDAAPEAFHRSVNEVRPSLIRTEADEVTYDLHVVLRFELELALVSGDLAVADLPGAWREGMRRHLGVAPRGDREGVLQDMHWAFGELGYFPTYTIGNCYAASLFAAARRALPALDADVAAGRFLPLRDWLRERVHRAGRARSAEEIVRGATGRGLVDDDLRAHLEAKRATLEAP